MRGVVEIWDGDELVLEEPNMLVDGAGELIADIMTASPSLSGIEDTPTSGILDASNYRIAAISFGTGSYYFNNGGRKLDSDKENLIDSFYSPLLTGSNNLSITPFIFYPSKSLFTYYHPDFTNIVDGSSLKIDKAKLDQLPTAPNPSLKTLEENTNTSAMINISEEEGSVAVSSVFPGNGQHCNFLPSAIMSSVMSATVFSAAPEAYYKAASLLGAFPEGSGTPYGNSLNNARVFYGGDAPSLTKVTTQVDGLFNEASSMDVSGFVNTVMSSVPDEPAYEMSSTSSGLCLSAPAEELNEGFPFVEYSLRLGAGDLGHVNAYGGIYHIGLWTIDMKESLLNGNTPPFQFSVLNNPRKYRLFCRKGLSKNLCYINDDEQYTPLSLKWRIYFR